MKALRSPLVTVALVLAACATGVNQDLPDDVGDDGSAGTLSDGGTPGTAGTGSPGASGTLPTAGTTVTNPFGGTGSTAGKGSGGASGSGSAGKGTGGSSGAATGGSGGKASGGSGGKASGGSAGSGGKASGGAAGTSGSGGSAGSVVVGSCDGTMPFVINTSYPTDAKVTAVCSGGTPCTLAKPAGSNGKTYEFSCLDKYNCGGQNPGTTNWSQPPWELTKACTP